MDKITKIILIIVSSLILIGLVLLLNLKIVVKKVTYQSDGTYQDNVIVSLKNLFFDLNEELWCVIDEQNSIKAENGKCTLSLTSGNYNLTIKNSRGNKWFAKKINIKDLQEFMIKKDKIYLVAGSTATLDYETESTNIIWEYDKTIIKFENGTITGLADGKTTLIGKNSDGVSDSVEVTVTSLVQNKTDFDFNKEYIKCKQYTNEEAKILDEFLEYEVNEAGYQTRAGDVAAARFLTLAFEYLIAELILLLFVLKQ